MVRDKQDNGGSYEITAGSWRIIGKLVGGDYPSWRQVLPRNEDLASGVNFEPERIAAMAPTIAKLPVASLHGSNHPIVVRGDGQVVELLWKEAPDEPYQDLLVHGPRPMASRSPYRSTANTSPRHSPSVSKKCRSPMR